jgi:hypothetical protein
MSHMRAKQRSLPAAAEARLGVVRMAQRVGEAARQAALEGARSAPSIAADQTPALPDAIHYVTDRDRARTAIERAEIERFRTVLGGLHRTIFE